MLFPAQYHPSHPWVNGFFKISDSNKWNLYIYFSWEKNGVKVGHCIGGLHFFDVFSEHGILFYIFFFSIKATKIELHKMHKHMSKFSKYKKIFLTHDFWSEPSFLNLNNYKGYRLPYLRSLHCLLQVHLFKDLYPKIDACGFVRIFR